MAKANVGTLKMLQDSAADWHREPPAPEDAAQALLAESGLDLPEDYLTLLRYSNGGEGRLQVQPWWFQIWPAQEVLGLNAAYLIPEGMPGFFAFGGSGGGDMLAFDTRSSPPWGIYSVPFIGMEEEYATLVAGSFAEFIGAMGQDAPAV